MTSANQHDQMAKDTHCEPELIPARYQTLFLYSMYIMAIICSGNYSKIHTLKNIVFCHFHQITTKAIITTIVQVPQFLTSFRSNQLMSKCLESGRPRQGNATGLWGQLSAFDFLHDTLRHISSLSIHLPSEAHNFYSRSPQLVFKSRNIYLRLNKKCLT